MPYTNTHYSISRDIIVQELFVRVYLVGFCSWDWNLLTAHLNPGRAATSCCRFNGDNGEDLLRS